MKTTSKTGEEGQQSALELVRQEPQPVAPATMFTSDTVVAMMQKVIEGGVTEQNVKVMDSLVDLFQKVESIQAEKAFAKAFQELQSEINARGVTATVPVPNNDGSIRYRFAEYEAIMEQVQPLLDKHGFTVSFGETNYEGDRIFKVLILQHSAGHKRQTKWGGRVGSGPPKATPTQADGAASTYAKRYALCDALNIRIVGMDTDAGADGAEISPEKAAELRERLKRVDGNEADFLKYAQAKTFEQIGTEKLEMLEQALAKKERAKIDAMKK